MTLESPASPSRLRLACRHPAWRLASVPAGLVVALVAGLLTLCADTSRAASGLARIYAEDHWSEDQGVPALPVTALLRTADGFLWVGSRRGLARYDGFRFAPVPGPGGTQPHVVALLETREGSLWVGDQEGLSRLRDGALQRIGSYGKPVTALAQGRDGTVYAATNTGVAIVREDGLQFLEGCTEPTLALVEDSKGLLWSGAASGTCVLHKARLERLTAKDGGVDRVVQKMLRDSRNRLWIGTTDGLFRQRRPGAPFERVLTGLPAAKVFSLGEDDEGHVWVGTLAGGLQRFDEAGEQPSAETLGPLAPIGALHADQDGSLWLGSAGGLDRLRPRPFQLITKGEGLSGNVVWSVYSDPGTNRVWAGLDGSGLDLIEGDHATPMGPRYGIATQSPSATVRTRDGALWIGTRSGGLLRVVGDRPEPVPAPEGGMLNGVRGLLEATDGTLWIGTPEGVIRVKDGKMTRIAVPSAKPVRVIIEDGHGDLWLGGERLTRLRTPSWNEDPPVSLDQTLRVTAILIDGADVWFTSYDRGLFVLHQDKLVSIGALDNRFQRACVGIQLDQAGRLWVATEGGLLSVSKQDLLDVAVGGGAPAAVVAYDERDGLLSSEFNTSGQTSSTKTPDGRLWFGTVAGVVVVDPPSVRKPAQAYPPRVDRVFIEGIDLGWRAGEVEVTHRRANLEVQYTAPTLLAPHRLEFRYRLEGRDTTWINAGNRRSAIYRQLESGDYLLELQASTDGGHWVSSPAPLRLRVRPAFVETTRFRLALWGLAFLLLLVVALGLSRLRDRQLRTRAKELEHLVEQRTGELASARDELEARVQQRTAELEHQLVERERLERQLLESQKLDSLGRLAGGVAHDLNNLLTAVLGYSAPSQLDGTVPRHIREDMHEIHKAGERAAALTRQLLAFARRQILESKLVDLNTVLLDLVKLLRRVIGENIELVTLTPPSTCPVLADPGQLEQVLVNLAVNARDAMPSGGKLVLETALQRVDGPTAGELGLPPGEYVVLAVRDNGTGMSHEVQQHLFEPFFTTKEKGKGTGLGLATCYGIVKQMSGHITAESAMGRGTTMRIYLPRAMGQIVADSRSSEASAPGGHETVLLVEDEPQVLALALRTLRDRGYRVLTATNGEEAMRVAAEAGTIDLLLADVVMPLMGGIELHTSLAKQRPKLRVLFMSGYVDSSLPGAAALPAGSRLLHKPFTPVELARRVREELDARGVQVA
jgi:signal transduction histidine kinase/ligand-binding sensor domain-containing protein/CheY-like chemotaxis protein